MPRCCSRRIQSEVACRAALRPLTVPAMAIAPPNSSSFSVRVVLPASGWEMMANVRRRAISCSSVVMRKRAILVDVALQHDRIFTTVNRLVVAAAHTDLHESQGLVQPYGGRIGGTRFQESLARTDVGGDLHQMRQQASSDATTAIVLTDTQIQQVRLAGRNAHDAVPGNGHPDLGHATGVVHAQAIAKDALGPGECVRQALNAQYFGDVRFAGAAKTELRHHHHVLSYGSH